MLKYCGWKDPITGLKECQNPRRKEGATYCDVHEQAYRDLKRGRPAGSGMKRTPAFQGLTVKLGEHDPTAMSGDRTHEYVINNELGALFNSAVIGATKRPARAFLFIGPAGSGKTDGAEALAAMAGFDFTKIDAASMTDPEAWFGTREIVVQDGVAVTDYRPSTFVESIQKPGITFIDEITRCRPEGINIIIPLIDHTRQVTNPLNGEIVHRHPQNFVIMAGNVGINYVGTSAVDPAFWTRATKVVFDYLPEDAERKVVQDASGCDDDTAYVLVRFAADTRAKALNDDDFPAISTRELIRTGESVADGLDRDLAVKFEILNGISGEGGNSSLRNEMQSIWNGVRVSKVPGPGPSPAAGPGWKCPTHGTVKVIPAGTSAKTNKPYNSFKACGTFGCNMTEDNTKKTPPTGSLSSTPLSCQDCGYLQPVGRTTLCVSCGATL